jgi:hypothetical protein
MGHGGNKMSQYFSDRDKINIRAPCLPLPDFIGFLVGLGRSLALALGSPLTFAQ